MTSTTPTKTTSRRFRVKRFFGIVALLSCTLGACYLVGYLHGRTGIHQLRAQIASEQQSLRVTREQLTNQLDQERRLSMTLAARRCLDQAIVALDARNFGIAEQQIGQAAKYLTAARVPGQVAELTKTLEAFRLVATEDLGPQRKQLTQWVSQLDQLVVIPNP